MNHVLENLKLSRIGADFTPSPQVNVEIARKLGRDVHLVGEKILELRNGELIPGPDYFGDITQYDGTDIFENGLPYYLPHVAPRGQCTKWVCVFPRNDVWMVTYPFATRLIALACATRYCLDNQSVQT